MSSRPAPGEMQVIEATDCTGNHADIVMAKHRPLAMNEVVGEKEQCSTCYPTN